MQTPSSNFNKSLLWFLTLSPILHASILGKTVPWTYVEVDDSRQKWGDWDDPSWLRYFGLDAADANRDGYLDIVSGRYVYLNPGGQMTDPWERVDLGYNTDGLLFVDVDGDEFSDIITSSLPDIFWFEATDIEARNWVMKAVTEIPATDHQNGQGYRTGDIFRGGKPEILLGAGEGLYLVEIPKDPHETPWKTTLLVEGASDEGFGIGDIDGDGDLDISGSLYTFDGDTRSPNIVYWWENPGTPDSEGVIHRIHQTKHDIDRVEIVELNGDGLPDIVYTEERWPGLEADASLVWLQAPRKPATDAWKPTTLITQFSMNNMDVGDVNNDGYPDIVTNEHKGSVYHTQLFTNDGKGNFVMSVVDTGKEMHLGANLADFDGDGDLDLFGHAWDNYQFLHFWRNDLIHGPVQNNEVRITESTDEGQDCFIIETPSATYYYQKEAGGFSSILDRDGIDWLQYEKSESPSYPASAASDYRGLPNMVFGSPDSGAGHPGSEVCVSVQIDGKTIRSFSKSGKWQWSWHFTAREAVLTVEAADPDHRYWFLYEGPIGGRFSPESQYYGTSDGGPVSEFVDYYKAGGGVYGQWDWVYFGDKQLDRVLLLEHLTPDKLPDTMGYLGNTRDGIQSPDGMVVFGFGRYKRSSPVMSQVPNMFRVSFVERKVSTPEDHSRLESSLGTPGR